MHLASKVCKNLLISLPLQIVMATVMKNSFKKSLGASVSVWKLTKISNFNIKILIDEVTGTKKITDNTE